MTYTNPRKSSLFDNEFDIVKFKELPEPYQLAMAWYMAVDGEAWVDVIEDVESPRFPDPFSNPDYHVFWRQVLKDMMPEFVATYGDVEFGVGEWPTGDLVRSIALDEAFITETPEEQTVADYAKDRPLGSYMEQYYTTEYPEEGRYPVILSGFDDETLEDGWKRFSLYTKSGFETTPVIFYPKAWHYELLASKKSGLVP